MLVGILVLLWFTGGSTLLSLGGMVVFTIYSIYNTPNVPTRPSTTCRGENRI